MAPISNSASSGIILLKSKVGGINITNLPVLSRHKFPWMSCQLIGWPERLDLGCCPREQSLWRIPVSYNLTRHSYKCNNLEATRKSGVGLTCWESCLTYKIPCKVCWHPALRPWGLGALADCWSGDLSCEQLSGSAAKYRILTWQGLLLSWLQSFGR